MTQDSISASIETTEVVIQASVSFGQSNENADPAAIAAAIDAHVTAQHSAMTEEEARAGVATSPRQATAQRMRQAAEGWWDAVATSIGKALATAATQSLARTAIGAEALGAAAAALATAVQRGNHSGEQAISTITGLSAALGAKADLVGGVIPSAQIPAVAISEFLGTVSTEAAMLALVGQRGDWCIRTDGANAGAWILSSEPSSTLGNWIKVPMPVAPVQSVNNQTGTVTLGAADVGAEPAGAAALAVSALEEDLSTVAFSGEYDDLSGKPSIPSMPGQVSTSEAGLQPASGYGTITYASQVTINFAARDRQINTISLTGALELLSSNLANGREVRLRLVCDGTQRALTFPTDWRFVGEKPANIAASKVAILSLATFGTANADVVAAYAVQS